MRTAKPAAREIQTSVQPIASRKPTTCFWRWNTPRSSASSANTNRLNRTQNSQFEGMSRVSEQPFYLAGLGACVRTRFALARSDDCAKSEPRRGEIILAQGVSPGEGG